MINAQPDCAQHWKEYRRRRNWFVAILPLGLAVAIAGDHVKSPTLHFILSIAWVLPVIWFAGNFDSWPCPRCGKPFVGRWWGFSRSGAYWFGPAPRHCRNCGLRAFADPSEAPASTPEQLAR
ncbi:MAG: hypothetical protein WAM91_13230 [Candidatus Acidiferrales bacterium]